tara:strand:+ start:119 stop:1078 length:960 start_codon:yes stop_codon:yes gene_type:complete
MPKIGITIGDPSGIGPEIVCKALASMSSNEQHNLVLIGNQDVISRADALTQSRLNFSSEGIKIAHVDSKDISFVQDGLISAGGGHAAYSYVAHAVKLALAREIDAIVTAPLNKAALHLAGYIFNGHTDLLRYLTKSHSSFMLFDSTKMRVILATTHVSLSQAITDCQTENILRTVLAGEQYLRRLGIETPRIAVAALNPHAGEEGLFGREEIDQIAPAIDHARTQGITADGPFPGDSVFLRALQGEFDLVVAHYHDQGLIPVKLADFDNAVNVTLGLPVIRTSVDHGTAFDIAWKGMAESRNMVSAIAHAHVLASRKQI